MIEAQQHSKNTGILYVVATPIGNLADMTERACQILSQADVIAAEDTRHTSKLLQAKGIHNQLVSLHDHNEQQRSGWLLTQLQQGKRIALVSDAGTPLISDPGYHLVQQVRQAGHPVVPIPGASAVITALSAAGLPTDRFYFAGFLPAKPSGRKQQLEALKSCSATLVFYEAPHRLLDCLQAMRDVFGATRLACLARELTKHYETFMTAPLDELLERVAADADQQRGEIVLLVAGCPEETVSADWQEACRWLAELRQHLPPSQACTLVARMTGVKKKALYDWLLATEEAKPE